VRSGQTRAWVCAWPGVGAAVLLAAGVLLGGCGRRTVGAGQVKKPEPLLVFAAASLRDVAAQIATAFEREQGTPVVFNLGGSGELAQQIQSSGKGDVFLSASENWMDRLAAKNLIDVPSRRMFASNQLLIVAAKDSAWTLGAAENLPGLAFRHLILADPRSVPAGQYAKAYLEGIRNPTGDAAGGSVWDAVKERVAPMPDVRAALAAVQADPAVVGIVYRTDALSSDGVRVLWEVPRQEGARSISYPGAVIAGSGHPEAARAFVEFLGSAEAVGILERYGFVVPQSPSPPAAGGGGR
jgi:molybdate transport system substrate-binding protein